MGTSVSPCIKVELPCERATDECYLGLYIHSILALQAGAYTRPLFGSM